MRTQLKPKSVTTSIRSRLIILSAVVAFLLFSTTLYIQNLVDDSSNKTLIFVSNNQMLQQQVIVLKSTVQTVERNLYQFTLLQERNYYASLAGLSTNMVKQIEEVIANPLAQTRGELRQTAILLHNLLKQLREQVVVVTTMGLDRKQEASAINLLKTTVGDLFDAAQENIQVLESRLGDMTSGSVVDLVITQGVLSYFIWAFSLISYLILVGSYVTFEFSVRRPIMQVANALEAYGEEGHYAASLRTNTEETETLVRAFRKMQNQVASRQQRLESVLDNAGEGIITLNEKYTIETFNNAAQYVFAMGLDEVLSKPFSSLLVDEEKEKIITLLEQVHNLDTGSSETVFATMIGRRKSGETFPVSMKLSHLNLEGDEHFIVMAEDISERQAMMESLRHLAEHDSLTGLYNRQYFMDELDREVSRSHRNPAAKCALLYIDLDNFKFVNDTLGHIAGDKVLIEVTMLLNKRMRKGDLLGRLGGDEFGLLLYEIDREKAVLTAEFFRLQLAEYKFKYEGKVLDVGCTIGVALLEPNIDTKEDLLARADIACHIAKRLGKNRAYVYEDDDQENMDSMYADMGWARRIKNAIEDNHFVFACQPIVDTKTGDTASYEVLLRMKDGKRNYVMPAGFLPSAERFGLMIDIDRWIIGRAIEALASLQKDNEGMRYSINLSAKSICDDSILREIKALLDQFSLPPN
ncbi:MAG: diguanylate cyclase, partial [Gammaproteobacteria bacterium]|nr:diguanylate cyclase [Gammaproteobacteria bacterium]